MKTIEGQEGEMTDMKGYKALTEGTEVEGQSRNLEAKCIYASLTPKSVCFVFKY